MKKIFFLFILIVLSWGIFHFAIANKYSLYGNKKSDVRIRGCEFSVELVNTSERMEKGLGGRDAICRSCGMLFDFFQKGNHSFWMKGMKFPLDIIWIADGSIVYVVQGLPADYLDIINPCVEADKVLEINAGAVEKCGIKEGDKVMF